LSHFKTVVLLDQIW